ncbi:MAG: 50S ribosomal protein L23 [Thermoplasmata archaeon]|nr:50S ribosomal protein L23 [Thermoplasmata archaeon]RLF45995.1 MAG: 50S ribosomal protein L23 [Thermoplasmata archaeon]HEC86426.1 50S ribosomal protein L23 [Thermoplasmatales archaeon]
MDPYEIIMHPYVTEKSMDAIEKRNALEFVVNIRANKKQIKEAVEKAFDVKVESVNTRVTRTGKHAVVKLKPEYSAEEVGMRIGIF